MTTTDAAGSDDARVEVPPRFWVAAVMLVVFGALFAWGVWAAVGNVVQVPALFGQYRDFVTQNGAPELAKSTPWPALLAALVVPALGWLATWYLGRRRGVLQRIVIFVAAYAGVAAVTVSLTGYVFQASSILG